MPNIANVLRDEITRLARKEIKSQTAVLRRASAQYRRDVAALKRDTARLQKRLEVIEKSTVRTAAPVKGSEDPANLRFVPKGLKSQRKRLGLSAKDYGRLVGVSEMAVYNWESGASRPRREYLPAIAEIRAMGKKEVDARLEALAAKPQAPRKRRPRK